jgi:hypothetical protein
MSGIGLLDRICGQKADGIDCTSLKTICCHDEFLRKRLSSILPNEGQISLFHPSGIFPFTDKAHQKSLNDFFVLVTFQQASPPSSKRRMEKKTGR